MKPRLRFHVLLVLAIIQFMLFVPVDRTFAEDNQQTLSSAILVVNTSFLNIRSGPGANYSIIATVVGGTELPVTGLYEDEVWYQVATNIGLGWVNREFTIGRGDFSSVPLIEYGSFAVAQTSVNTAALGQGGGGVATGTGAGATNNGGVFGVSPIGGDLRTAPNGSAPIVAALVPADDNIILPVIDIAYFEGRPYYNVNYPNYGNVWGDRFRVRPMECNGLSVIQATDFIGTIPVGISGPFQFEPGDEMYVAGPGRDGLIEIVTLDGSRGLLPVDKTRGRDASVVNYCDGVNPSANTVTVTTNTGTIVTNVNPGQGGGVVVPAITAAARVVVNTPNLNIRTGPSASFSIVATVSGGTELAVLGVADDGVWYLVEGTFGQGWLNNEFVIFRGDYSAVPVLNINP